ncbi:MAG: glycosyltransferase [Verrucomicrobiae bacterium]|nr:glycosyltransferase [Verrucomicrobiae bacterium]
MIFYELLFWPALLLASPYYLRRMRRRGGYGRDFGERFGRFHPEKRARLENLRPVWIHAVSVGEVGVALDLIRKLREIPGSPPLALSTTTSTGHALAERRLPADVPLFYYPLDSRLCFGRTHRLLRPKALVLVEAELWPNHLRFLARKGIPAALVNARLSPRCLPRYRRFRRLFAPGLRAFRLVTLQSETDAPRLAEIGFPKEALRVVGSLKYDAPRDPASPARAKIFADLAIFRDRPMWVAGSTHPGEEELIVEIFLRLRARHPALCLALAPRHAERAEAVAEVLRRRGVAFVLRSRLDGACGSPDAVLLDTTGELRFLYERAAVIFMGKSLVGRGGQNLIEPAACGKPVLHGPHMENFPSVVADFAAAKAAVTVPDAAALEREVDDLLANPARCAALGRAAAALVESKKGALERTVRALSCALGFSAC